MEVRKHDMLLLVQEENDGCICDVINKRLRQFSIDCDNVLSGKKGEFQSVLYIEGVSEEKRDAVLGIIEEECIVLDDNFEELRDDQAIEPPPPKNINRISIDFEHNHRFKNFFLRDNPFSDN